MAGTIWVPGEIEDARAALGWLRDRYPGLPYTLAGFSFGSRVILSLGCALPDAERLIALGFPAKRDPVGVLAYCAVPKVFIQSTHDEHGPPSGNGSVLRSKWRNLNG